MVKSCSRTVSLGAFERREVLAGEPPLPSCSLKITGTEECNSDANAISALPYVNTLGLGVRSKLHT